MTNYKIKDKNKVKNWAKICLPIRPTYLAYLLTFRDILLHTALGLPSSACLARGDVRNQIPHCVTLLVLNLIHLVCY